jgi:hypothetical protein
MAGIPSYWWSRHNLLDNLPTSPANNQRCNCFYLGTRFPNAGYHKGTALIATMAPASFRRTFYCSSNGMEHSQGEHCVQKLRNRLSTNLAATVTLQNADHIRQACCCCLQSLPVDTAV